MADIANRYGENVTGKFYVDDQCIDCDLCRETALKLNFTRNDDGGYSYVYKNNPPPLKKKPVARKQWKAAPWKPSAITATPEVILWRSLIFLQRAVKS